MRKTIITACTGAVLLVAGCGSSDSNSSGSSDSGAFTDIAKLAASVKDKQSDKKTAHFTMKGGVAGQQMDGKGSVDMSDPNAVAESMDLNAGGQQMTIVLKDGVVYLKSPSMAKLAGGSSKPWMKIDSNGSGPMAKVFGSIMRTATQQSDPTKMLDQIQETGKITGSKQEGDLTHYTVMIDTKKSFERSMKQMQDSMGSLGEKGAQAQQDAQKKIDDQINSGKMPKEIPAELWLNDENLPQKVEMSMPTVNPTTQQSETAKVTAEYTDWGQPVTIDVPPAEQVTDMDAEMSKLGK